MTDDPGRESPTNLPARRPPQEPEPVARFSAPPSAHRFGLTSERAAKIVRQSANARWISFLAVAFVVVFVIAYYFYEVGFPGIKDSSRLGMEVEAQQITAVERGYNLYQANCARCHGVDGQGGIGPVLHDQMKLFVHLNAQYVKNVLSVGGRYVCGTAKSLMPVWLDANGGPLNYRQVDDLIAFIRSPNTNTYQVRNAETLEVEVERGTGKPKTFTGWVDEKFQPAPNATPVPACWKDGLKTAAPSGSPSPSGSGAPSESPGASASPAPSSGPSVTLKVAAEAIAYDVTTLEAPANTEFAIEFANNDAGIDHNVEIRDGGGTTIWKGDIFPGVETRTYKVPAIPAGTYTFICTVHPIPAMTGTLTVK